MAQLLLLLLLQELLLLLAVLLLVQTPQLGAMLLQVHLRLLLLKVHQPA
jgi:hypothetical protein